ncbi:hypothetical protein BCV69DRAFT_250334 [Microstroma glucosiphilum]|uniref:Mitochondrial import inner membrane translocase subunit Tim21 n=1 Tax=Pseudomicrostroma glucosiphilum TaxID=1684307 RepID=A0A316U5Q3_9BASI|nr:hypothetical protein BCV69DRAFT_250334 [Pseudomicrostroma glucosiphilum]PWN19791.1 hypothetical protein BCV69DRAFT_250334 [Pseudomicrostroma glucosiphilum]
MKEFKLDPSLSSSSSSSASSAASSSRSAAEQRQLLDELRQAASSSSSSAAAARFPSQPNATAERLLDSQGQRAPMPPGLGGSLLGDYPLPRRRGLVAKATGEGQSWQELKTGQKVARTAFKGSQVGLVLFGSAFTLVISYALLSELFAPNSPTVIYKDACRRVEDNKEIYEHLLPPFKFHTHSLSPVASSPTNLPSGRRRASPLPSSVVVADKSGQGDVMLLRFFVEARDKDRDWSYLERSRDWVRDQSRWVTSEAVQLVETIREKLAGEEVEEGEGGRSPLASLRDATTTDESKSSSSTSEPGVFSRTLSSGLSWLTPSFSTSGASKSLKGKREPGTFSSGEVHAELKMDAESGKWEYRRLWIDIPKSGTIGSRRVWIAKKEGDVKR